MKSVDILARLAATQSRKEKEQILLEAAQADSHEFFQGMRLALDPLASFGITKVAEIVEDDGEPGDYTFAEFLELTRKLRNRELTGQAARDSIHTAATRCDVATWNGFYRRLLLKNLNVGIDVPMVNKVLQAIPEAHRYLIPLFKCQQAQAGAACHMHGHKLIEVALAGVRALAVMDRDDSTVTLCSRTGRPFAFPELHNALHQLLPRLPGSLVLDGELVSPHGLRHLMTLVRRTEYHADMAAIRYALYDIIPLGDFRRAYCAKPQHERHHLLEALQECGLWRETAGRVYVLPQIAVDLDSNEGQAQLVEFTRQAQADGQVGIMMKDPDAAYQGKRSTAWLRLAAKNN